jgi:peptidoglycan lytic transglycosylase G
VSARGIRRVAVLAAAVAFVAFLLALFQPFAGDGGERVRVAIPRDSSLGTIADTLDEAGVIGNKTLFQLRARLSGSADSLKPGIYYLREDSPYGDVLDKLEAGPGNELIQLTIPEGLSRREVAPMAGRAGVRGNYVAATRDPSVAVPREFRGERIPDKEGFMFPATYELRNGARASALVQKQAAAFAENFGALDLSYARRKNLTPYDVLKIASMVEREAQLDRERLLVAAVIYNRLKQGQPLGIDATIRYATGNWTRPLKQSELASDSAYNTRTRAGLPPTPIGNPGLASLHAAARPAKVDYLYYVVKPGTCGQHAFSATFEQFEQDQAKYNAAREAAGGKSPTTCPTG